MREKSRIHNCISLLLTVLMALCLNGCTIQTASKGIDAKATSSLDSKQDETPTGVSMAACLLFDPISWSEKDTDQTIAEVKEHNRKIVRYCSG